MHYMLTESKNDPKNDPLLFWFNGGPGCSSFSGAFEELGPFYVNKDGKTLFENVYSWNARANVMYLESPIGTGFSYDTKNPKYSQANDSQSLSQNYAALVDFFTRAQPKYKDRPFYLSGESYAGIYLPMLGAKIAQNLDSFPNKNFKGVAIGNGFMNVKILTNSLIRWSYYHGRIAEDNWETLKGKCCKAPPGKNDTDYCDWTQHLVSTNNIDYGGNKADECGRLLDPIVNASGIFTTLDPYNYYEDCYAGSQITKKRKKRAALKQSPENVYAAGLVNRDSTDPFWGYPCYQEAYVGQYFNDPDVQDAYHIDPAWRKAGNKFSDCNMDLYNQYKLTYDDMEPFFDVMLKNLKNFRILVYNGDVDTVCNFLGDAEFIHGIASSTDHPMSESTRTRWFFRNVIAGFAQTFTYKTRNITIDVVTVKGAGHMVPLDRPGPSLQMITNFIYGNNYNSSDLVDVAAKPQPLIQNSASRVALPWLLVALVSFLALPTPH
ncbi:Protein F32A5.3 [Aphelenchoides avenae]|nr:Protein F32A5.3 [Aphelenchus avenae]